MTTGESRAESFDLCYWIQKYAVIVSARDHDSILGRLFLHQMTGREGRFHSSPAALLQSGRCASPRSTPSSATAAPPSQKGSRHSPSSTTSRLVPSGCKYSSPRLGLSKLLTQFKQHHSQKHSEFRDGGSPTPVIRGPAVHTQSVGVLVTNLATSTGTQHPDQRPISHSSQASPLYPPAPVQSKPCAGSRAH